MRRVSCQTNSARDVAGRGRPSLWPADSIVYTGASSPRRRHFALIASWPVGASYVSRMPIVQFDALPDSARVWVFASDQPLTGAVADTLLAAVDRFLSEWKAHGVP